MAEPDDAGSADPLRIAERLFAAIEAGDIDAVGRLYAPDLQVWHNTDGLIQDRDANLRTLGWVVANFGDLCYHEVRRDPTPAGFVQQHVLRATTPAGDAMAIPACLVAAVNGGQITRIDEYLDSAQLAPLLARARPH